MADIYKVPLVLTPQPEGGYTVTSPAVPELVTEGETLADAHTHAQDALNAVLELYEDLGKAFPPELRQDPDAEAILVEYPLAVA